MAKLVASAKFAVLRAVPPDSNFRNLVGTSGVLEIWESEQAYPGKHGALFYYPAILNNSQQPSSPQHSSSPQTPQQSTVLRCLKTSFSYELSMLNDTVSFKRKNHSYVFEVDNAIITYKA